MIHTFVNSGYVQSVGRISSFSLPDNNRKSAGETTRKLVDCWLLADRVNSLLTHFLFLITKLRLRVGLHFAVWDGDKRAAVVKLHKGTNNTGCSVMMK
jgi:hypothetical protein